MKRATFGVTLLLQMLFYAKCQPLKLLEGLIIHQIDRHALASKVKPFTFSYIKIKQIKKRIHQLKFLFFESGT